MAPAKVFQNALIISSIKWRPHLINAHFVNDKLKLNLIASFHLWRVIGEISAQVYIKEKNIPIDRGISRTEVQRLALTRIVKLAAIVGRWEERHQLTLGKEFIAILHHLMSPADQVKLVFL